jgi:hypothetical protein
VRFARGAFEGLDGFELQRTLAEHEIQSVFTTVMATYRMCAHARKGGRVDDKAFLVAVSRELEPSRLKIVISGWFSSLRARQRPARGASSRGLLGLAIAD